MRFGLPSNRESRAIQIGKHPAKAHCLPPCESGSYSCRYTLPAAADPFGPVKGGEFELAAGAVGEPLIGRSPGCPTGFGRPQASYVLSPTMPAPSEAKSDGLTHPGRGTLKWEIAARPLTAY
jgi:hypothetical protein